MSDLPSRLTAALEGRYRVEGELGAGGMATVFLAEDLRHKRRVAVKVLRPDLATALGPDRFVREIEITAGLTHPHILPVLDSGQADGLFYYVMPFVEGESLRDRLDRGGALPLDEALSIAEEVGEALESAHRHGVVHRDVKPANILLVEGRAYVADFGIARALTAAGGERLTATGLAIGTPSYMSPEQAAGAAGVDHRADQFALGCVLYEMLTGEPPHTGSTPQAVIAKVITDPPTPVSTVRASVPPHVEAAVHRALSKSPADRFPDVGGLLRALRVPPSAPSHRSATSGARRIVLPAAVGVVLALAAAAGLLWLADQESPATLADLGTLIAAGDLEGAWDAARGMDPGAVPDTLWAQFTAPVTIVSSPPGASVSRRPYDDPAAPWTPLGTTPLSVDRFPSAPSLLRLEVDGHHTALAGFKPAATDTILLDPVDAVDGGLRTIRGDLPVYLGGPEFAFRYIAPNLSLAPVLRLTDYRLDRHEVTNRDYQAFVDDGGYADRGLWEHPLVRDGEEISWEEAMQAFTDSTGRAGPSTWRFGTFPEGRADFPVTGVSWYESAAYARWAGRELPTVYHWFRAASPWFSDLMIPASNMEGAEPLPVGTSGGLSQYGIHDMAGNAREWAFNATGTDRFILGGGWSDSRYMFTVANGAPPFDRSPMNGFRLADYSASAPELEATRRPIPQAVRDFAGQTPVSDERFATFRRLYDYDATPLDATVHRTDTTDLWIREYVTFDAAYGAERVGLHLFLPRGGEGPLQTVVYFPGSSALWLDEIDDYPTDHVDMVVRSGRAVAFPVLQSTFGRDDDFVYRRQDESNAYRDHVFHWARDIGRTIDYLETRPDLDTERLGYLGYSWGGMLAPIMLVTDPRPKVAVLGVPGLSPLPTQPEVDPFNFVTRVSVPVLMLSGEYDMVHPLESSARPMFELWNAPAEQKRHVVVDGAHVVPYPVMMRETVAWFDRFLGPVR